MQSGDSGGHPEAGGSPSRRCEALFKIDAAAARSIMLEGKISALQLALGASSREHFQMDTTRAVEGNLGATRGSLEQGISEVQKAPDTLQFMGRLPHTHSSGKYKCKLHLDKNRSFAQLDAELLKWLMAGAGMDIELHVSAARQFGAFGDRVHAESTHTWPVLGDWRHSSPSCLAPKSENMQRNRRRTTARS